MTLGIRSNWLRITAVICTAGLVPGDVPMFAQEQTAGAAAPKLRSPDQLNSLVAPLALYPDPLLAQVLAASTYPLEIVQCARWLTKNSKLTGENLTKAAAKQPWDPSVQALVAFPEALKMLDANIQWTQDIGNAFLDQQSDVMDSIQRMRKKAKDGGKLETTKEQNVEVKTIENKTIIEIQPSNPQVIYVPSYDPVVVYGAAPYYAYPAVAYPYGAVAATAAISFGVGVMMGAFWGGCCGGGGWGWNAGWSNNNININNNFNNRYGYNSGNRNNIGNGNRGNGNWQHNPEHRRSTPYSNRDTAQRFGGTSRDSSGRTQRFDNRGGQAGAGQNRGPQASTRESGANRAQSGARGNSGGDRVGNRSIGSSSPSKSALGGSGSRAQGQASSNRGFSSTRQSGGFGGGGARSSGRSMGGGRRR
ncbi:conserved exported hypothetical protein [Candidatus Sulfopaludibacter sp. SbA3]|nr:conserved exported hypothetical protein [Candidatus Sulfopaludibacter sp. SbA3]